MSALFAFLHHIAAFALVAALIVESVLIRDRLDVATARKLLRADLAFGASAGAVLAVGILRVLYFEKGADYYLHSHPFLAKAALFAIVGLLSIYPTAQFLSWRQALRAGHAPDVGDRRQRRIRSVIDWELAGVALLILNAVLMARGVGSFG